MSRIMPYVSVTKIKGKPCLVVEMENHEKLEYPLTFDGCRKAGRDLFLAGAESWMCSSSVDFPQETLPGFRGDVRELMDTAFQQEMDKAGKPRKTVIAKMLAHCSKPEFLKTLTPTEKQTFMKIKNQTLGR